MDINRQKEIMGKVLSREIDRVYVFGWLCALHLLLTHEKHLGHKNYNIVYLLLNGLYNYMCVRTHAHIYIYAKFNVLYSAL